MISHDSYHHQGRRVSDRPVVFWLKILGSVAPRMGVAEPLRRPTASRGRKRPRAAARLVGTSRAACCRPRLRVNPFLVWFVFLWLLFSGVWETLIFGTGDWFAFGEPFFCGLFTPTYPLPGHRLVPESQTRPCWRLQCSGFVLVQGVSQGKLLSEWGPSLEIAKRAAFDERQALAGYLTVGGYLVLSMSVPETCRRATQ